MSRVYAHFIGVGGAGMSGIARVLHERGVAVTGSDLKDSRYARSLVQAGVPVYIGHAAENLGDPEVVVVSSAIPENNPELVEARRRGIDVWPRAKMLAHMGEGRKTLAVAGTHGKTTTSSMLASVLAGLGLDPTFMIGGELNDMGANARGGTGEYYVVEADESDGSLVFLDPYLAIVTNVEADHLDHYSGIDEVVDTFGEFLGSIAPSGAAVVCADDPRLPTLAREHCDAHVVTYGRHPDAQVRCEGLERDGAGYRFCVTFDDGRQIHVRTGVPGVHNVVNATGVLAAIDALGLDVAEAAEALAGFTGVRRRFERVGEAGGVVVIDDYAHHPTEVRATLAAAADAGFDRVWVVFQPHRYSRTAALGREFGKAFSDADRIVCMDVYSAGEAPIPGVSGKTVVDAVLDADHRAQVAYFPHRADVCGYLVTRMREGDLVLTMGAGDVTTLAGELVQALGAREDDRETA
ncbi:MAG: UDP-N-acetylmuramate--L-alanine ligase [Coriobacteriales bacterium]|nr:UDP-N-acetylmuramate--L-alanine ligase [Actinomycetes bacterium]